MVPQKWELYFDKQEAEAAAATRIQAMQRGKAARKQVATGFGDRSIVDSMDAEAAEEVEAAVRIQAPIHSTMTALSILRISRAPRSLPGALDWQLWKWNVVSGNTYSHFPLTSPSVAMEISNSNFSTNRGSIYELINFPRPCAP